jgi:hypothetical protein
MRTKTTIGKITIDQIKLLATFLKSLQETTKTGCAMYMSQELKEANLPYYNNLGKILVDKGILSMTKDPKDLKRRIYHWQSTTDANIHMAKALIKECQRISKHNPSIIRYKKSTKTNIPVRTLPIRSVSVNTITLNDIRVISEQMITKLTTLGFTRESALSIVKDQII